MTGIATENQAAQRTSNRTAHDGDDHSHSTSLAQTRFAMTRKAKITRWSFREDRRLIELAASGKSLEAAADRMNRTQGSVVKAALRLGVSLKSETPASKTRKSEPSERLKAARDTASRAAARKSSNRRR